MRKQNDRRELTFLNNKSTNNYEYKTFERNYLSQRPHGEIKKNLKILRKYTFQEENLAKQ